MPRPGRACSCYVLRSSCAAVVLDFGSGSLGNLRLAIDYSSIDAVIISHMHADHFLDLIPLRYGLKYGPSVRQSRMPLWLPPGGSAMLRALCNTFTPESAADFLNEVFEVREYDPARPLDVGDLRLSFQKTRHYIDTYAMRAEGEGASLVYSADTAPCEALVEHARGCGLFLCEATLGLGTEEGDRGHLSAEEAGEIAARAGARHLVLTHYHDTISPGELFEAARRRFSGQISLADDGSDFFA